MAIVSISSRPSIPDSYRHPSRYDADIQSATKDESRDAGDRFALITEPGTSTFMGCATSRYRMICEDKKHTIEVEKLIKHNEAKKLKAVIEEQMDIVAYFFPNVLCEWEKLVVDYYGNDPFLEPGEDPWGLYDDTEETIYYWLETPWIDTLINDNASNDDYNEAWAWVFFIMCHELGHLIMANFVDESTLSEFAQLSWSEIEDCEYADEKLETSAIYCWEEGENTQYENDFLGMLLIEDRDAPLANTYKNVAEDFAGVVSIVLPQYLKYRFEQAGYTDISFPYFVDEYEYTNIGEEKYQWMWDFLDEIYWANK